ncbi:hypothetical protein D3C85_233870 [compost metagenome]
MYHLFNSVYVDTERRVNRAESNITISKHIGFEYHPGPNETAGDQIGFAASLDVVEPEVLLEWLMIAMQSEEKVFIYCDGETYVRLYGLLVRTVFPNIDLLTYKWIMLCKKATFNTSLTNWKQAGCDVLSGIDLTSKSITESYNSKDPLLPMFEQLLSTDRDVLSLEWQLVRLIAEDTVGEIPARLRNILRRIALANTHDCLDVWGRVITDPEHWEFAGADLDTLLDAPTVFEGCLLMSYTNNRMFLRPGLFEKYPQDKWLCGLLRELDPLLDRVGEGPTAKRTRLILAMLESEDDLKDPKALLARVKQMFLGSDRLAMPNRDSSKYDENLIRYLLGRSKEDLRTYLKGATW